MITARVLRGRQRMKQDLLRRIYQMRDTAQGKWTFFETLTYI